MSHCIWQKKIGKKHQQSRRIRHTNRVTNVLFDGFYAPVYTNYFQEVIKSTRHLCLARLVIYILRQSKIKTNTRQVEKSTQNQPKNNIYELKMQVKLQQSNKRDKKLSKLLIVCVWQNLATLKCELKLYELFAIINTFCKQKRSCMDDTEQQYIAHIKCKVN